MEMRRGRKYYLEWLLADNLNASIKNLHYSSYFINGKNRCGAASRIIW